MEDLWLYLRIFCFLGCTYSLFILATSRFRQWDEWTVKTQDHWYALTGWVFACMYGVIELILQGNEGGSRLIVTSLVVALTLRALLRKGELKAHSIFSDKKDQE